MGYQAIKNNDCNVIVAGGQESMTRAHHSSYVRGNKLGSVNLNDTLLVDGLTDAFHNVHMGNTAERLATIYDISRVEQDEYAVKSQQKAENAIKSGYFTEEIVGITAKNGVIDKDEFPKFGTTLEGLAKLRTCFQKVYKVVFKCLLVNHRFVFRMAL